MRAVPRASRCIMSCGIVAAMAACVGMSDAPGLAVDAAGLGHAERFARACRLMPTGVDRVAVSILVGGADRVVRAVGGCGQDWGTEADPFGEHPMEIIEILDYCSDEVEPQDLDWWGIRGSPRYEVVSRGECGAHAVRLGPGIVACSRSESLIRAVVARAIDGSDSALLRAGQDLSVDWGSDELVVLTPGGRFGDDLSSPSSPSVAMDCLAVQVNSAAGRFEVMARGGAAADAGSHLARFIGASVPGAVASVKQDGRYVLEMVDWHATSFDAESALGRAFGYVPRMSR